FEHRKHRQHEGRGFACAGLCNAEHIPSRQYVRDSLILNWWRSFVAGRFDSRENFGRYTEMGESHITSEIAPIAPDCKNRLLCAGTTESSRLIGCPKHRVGCAKVNA